MKKALTLTKSEISRECKQRKIELAEYQATSSLNFDVRFNLKFHSIYLKISPQGTIDTHSKQHIKTQKHTHKRNTHKRNKM